MENKKLIAVAIIALIVGGLIGYSVGAGCPDMKSHMMPDGSMMENSGMQGMMMDMNAGLRGKTGDIFDHAFLSQMIIHHEGAVEMAQSALKSANHQEIKSMARDIISAQTREIAQMKAWLKDWYNR